MSIDVRHRPAPEETTETLPRVTRHRTPTAPAAAVYPAVAHPVSRAGRHAPSGPAGRVENLPHVRGGIATPGRGVAAPHPGRAVFAGRAENAAHVRTGISTPGGGVAAPNAAPAWAGPPPAGLGWAPAAVATRPGRPGMRWGWIAVALVVAVAAVALVAGAAAVVAAHRSMTVQGTATVYGMYGYVTPGSSCVSSAYDGTPVSIYDASGDLVGTTSLTGTGTARNTWSTSSYGYADSCEYAFTLTDVPATDEHYRVMVGSGSGQGVGFSRDQLETSGAAVTLGR